MSFLRHDATTNDWVIFAPERSRRPHQRPERPSPDGLQKEAGGLCPFCPGNEYLTPHEIHAVRNPGSLTWRTRVVPNKFPAFGPWSDEGDKAGLFARRAARGRQEVVVHSPRHVRTFADLTGREVEQVAEAWRNRTATAKEQGFPYVQALVNEGRAAGASLAQLERWLERAVVAARLEDVLEG